MSLTHRQQIVLAALSANSPAAYAPVQVQKLFFLIDQHIAELIGGKQFAFEPYDYGPFDRDVYAELEELKSKNLIAITPTGTGERRRYALTSEGQELGAQYLSKLPETAQEHLAKLSKWVCSLSFSQLVGSIYKAYPDMRANSIFKD
jgi:hypothetical protein